MKQDATFFVMRPRRIPIVEAKLENAKQNLELARAEHDPNKISDAWQLVNDLNLELINANALTKWEESLTQPRRSVAEIRKSIRQVMRAWKAADAKANVDEMERLGVLSEALYHELDIALGLVEDCRRPDAEWHRPKKQNLSPHPVVHSFDYQECF